MKGRFLRFIGG